MSSYNFRCIAPFRPLPLEGGVHRYLADFDWIAAVQMLVESATRACRCPVHVVTDVDTNLPVPTLKYDTSHRRLMLWTLEACLCYLESDDFDRDTVMLDIDQLIYRDLSPWFSDGADLTVLIRPRAKHMHVKSNPFLNGAQWWRVRGKDRLVGFYRHALAIAEGLPENQIVWGADTTAVRQLLEPLVCGTLPRAGLTVTMIDSAAVLESFSRLAERKMHLGVMDPPSHAILDFRGRRKALMPAVYRATFGSLVPQEACP